MSNTLVKRKKSLNLGQYSFVLIFAAQFLIYFFVNFKNGVPMLRWTGVTNILRHSAIVGLLSYGMAMIIITGDIDLSIGAILGCVSSFGCVIANIMLNAGVPTFVGIAPRKSSSRKYVCPCCGMSIRATRAVNVACLDCDEQLLLVG